MVKLELKIESGNAAFAADPHGEIARILHGVIANLENRVDVWRTLFDLNGNNVGQCHLTITAPDEEESEDA